MPYCSLEEAWAPVSYKKSDVYDKEGDSIYPEICAAGTTNEPVAPAQPPQRIMKSARVSRMPLMKEVILHSSGGESTDNQSNQKPVRSQPKKRKPAAKRFDDSIDQIIANVEEGNHSSEEEPFDFNSTYKELSKEFDDDKNEIIKNLIAQNEKLKSLLKKSTASTSKGIFNIGDFIIVFLLGIIMLFVLDYIYRIAISRNR
jgi:hypothetical protein